MPSFLRSKRFLIALFVVFLIVMIYFFFFSVNPISVRRYGANCTINTQCKNLVGVDCGVLYDRPYYYIDKWTGNVIAACGGFATNLSKCPPPAWTC